MRSAGAGERGKRFAVPMRKCRKEDLTEQDLRTRKSGKAETEEVSADFWLLLFRHKSNPRRGAEYPLAD